MKVIPYLLTHTRLEVLLADTAIGAGKIISVEGRNDHQVLVRPDLLELSSYQSLTVTAHCPDLIAHKTLETENSINNCRMLHHLKRHLGFLCVKSMLVLVKTFVKLVESLKFDVSHDVL